MISSEIIKGQKSWVLENKNIKLCLTEKGGHMAPVVFMRDTDKPVEPFYINPWAEEDINLNDLPDLLDPLRGDFFCLPFGGDNSWNGESHPPHGETAGSKWAYVQEDTDNLLTLKMDTSSRNGSVVKKIQLKEGENNLYISHDITGFAGPASLGHHAIFPGGTKKNISTSPIKFGYTDNNKGAWNGGEYYSLAPLKKFESLEKVPSIWKESEFTDCSVFPAREGFVDILQVFNKPDKDFAWSAVTVPEEGYLWFSLKDPAILSSTVLWMENYGRHQHPWNGRNCCIGVEDVCSSFADGLAVSAEDNFLSRQGIKTSCLIKDNETFSVKYIQGVVRIPGDFDKVKTINKKDNGIELVSFSGRTVYTEVNVDFL